VHRTSLTTITLLYYIIIYYTYYTYTITEALNSNYRVFKHIEFVSTTCLYCIVDDIFIEIRLFVVRKRVILFTIIYLLLFFMYSINIHPTWICCVCVGVFGESKRGFAGSSIVYFFADRKTILYMQLKRFVMFQTIIILGSYVVKNENWNYAILFFYLFTRTVHIVNNRPIIIVCVRCVNIPLYNRNLCKYIKLLVFSSQFSRPDTFCTVWVVYTKYLRVLEFNESKSVVHRDWNSLSTLEYNMIFTNIY